MDVLYDRKREVKNTCEIFDLSNWNDGGTAN